MKIKDANIVMIHGRPKSHPIHIMYGELVGADFVPEDVHLRWHDQPQKPKIYRYISWILTTFFFPKRRKYDVFFSDCIRIPLLFMKKLRIIKKRQKLVTLIADESLFFIKEKRYSRLTCKMMTEFFRVNDFILCIGDLQEQLLIELLPENQHSKIKKIYNGLQGQVMESYQKFKPDLTTKDILIIGNMDAPWRLTYKGIDVMIDGFQLAYQKDPSLRLHIVGSYIMADFKPLLDKHHWNPKDDDCPVKFPGKSSNIIEAVTNKSLCIHFSRGDAFPTTTLETLALGIPTMVSNFTGTSSIMQKVDENLVGTLTVDTIESKINWYFALNPDRKTALSLKGKEVISKFNQEETNKLYLSQFQSVLN